MEAGEAGPSGGSGELGSQEGDAATKPAKKKAVAQHVAPVYQVRIFFLGRVHEITRSIKSRRF